MTRPTRRTSALAGKNPVTGQVTQDADPTPSPAPAPEQAPAAAAPERPAASAAGTKRPRRPKIAFEMHAEDSARMRGAVMATMMQEPHRSLTDFINRTLMAEVERLEATYNGGAPFPPVGTGVMPPGRRMGE